MPVVPAGHSPASSVLAMAWVSATWSSSLIAHMTASIIPPFSRQQICLQARYASLETLLSLEARRKRGEEERGDKYPPTKRVTLGRCSLCQVPEPHTSMP